MPANEPQKGRRVVFDANILIQAALSDRGPAFACVQLVRDNGVELVVTRMILEEVTEVLVRLSSKPKYEALLSRTTIESFADLLRRMATVCDEPSRVFMLPRDPDDEVYVNLAIATGATLIASRDRDLLDLMESDQQEAISLRQEYPDIRIVSPVVFLRQMESDG